MKSFFNLSFSTFSVVLFFQHVYGTPLSTNSIDFTRLDYPVAKSNTINAIQETHSGELHKGSNILSSGERFSKENANEESQAELGNRSVYYLNKNFSNDEARSINYFEGRVFREAEKNDLSLGIDIEGQFASSYNWFSNFSANEFYFRTSSLWSGFSLLMGRRRTQWSRLDSQWNLGAFQPIFKVDVLNPREQGLTGVFLVFNRAKWNLEFFGSPFFLPDQGPMVETEDGHFVRRDPWFFYPPSEIKINQVRTPVAYTVDKPTVPEIIINKGYGIKAQYGKPDEDGFLGRVAWSYKPMNQLLLGLDGLLALQGAEALTPATLKIQLHPEVGYHHVMSADLVYKINQFIFSLSVLEDDPEKKDFDRPWTYQNHTSAHLVGSGVNWHTETGWHWGANYIKREGGHSKVMGPQKDFVGDTIPQRYLWSEMLKSEISFQRQFNFNWAFEGTLEWRRELQNRSDLYSGQIAILYNSHWKFYFGADMLKSQNKNASESDYIEANAANDRAYGGLHYVF